MQEGKKTFNDALNCSNIGLRPALDYERLQVQP
jgi:hypothetical protein